MDEDLQRRRELSERIEQRMASIGAYLRQTRPRQSRLSTLSVVGSSLVAALTASLFFGGWQVPYLQADGFHFPWDAYWSLPHPMVTVLQVASFGAKVLFFCWFLLLIRWTLPRFRYDQLMHLGWKILLPLSVLNIIVTGLVIVSRS